MQIHAADHGSIEKTSSFPQNVSCLIRFPALLATYFSAIKTLIDQANLDQDFEAIKNYDVHNQQPSEHFFAHAKATIQAATAEAQISTEAQIEVSKNAAAG